jgi:ATP-dependent Lon protease
MVLDEIDKLGESNPAAALLEILDPDQNVAFVDHYLNVPFDLSQILFITTANVIFDIPTALRDRLEIIELPGYLETEKATITRRHLLPRQQAIHGLTKKSLILRPDAIRSLITHYTREPGLRNLDRTIATLCRKIARQIAEGKRKTITLSAKDLPTYVGQPAFVPDTQIQSPMPGLVTGLAATPTGGEHFAVEATAMPGNSDLVLTGQLGDVMKESARAALSYVRTQATQLNIDPDLFNNTDLHIHVPAGAVPKDGPSAGLAITICLTSLLTNRATKRNMAFTGEITLTGRVLRVGGISDKILAARRAGIRHVILPETNRTDINNLPQTACRGLKFNFVNTIAQALAIAFT